jgi:hypothetical protein
MTNDGRLHLRAKVMVSRHALSAVHVAGRKPADTDALSHLNSLRIRTDGRDPTNDLVAENSRVLRDAPVIVEDGEIRVTQTAVVNPDFNVLDPERSGINVFDCHRLFRRLRDPCLVHRVSLLFAFWFYSEDLTVVIDLGTHTSQAERVPERHLVPGEYRLAEVFLQRYNHSDRAKAIPGDENTFRIGRRLLANKRPL